MNETTSVPAGAPWSGDRMTSDFLAAPACRHRLRDAGWKGFDDRTKTAGCPRLTVAADHCVAKFLRIRRRYWQDDLDDLPGRRPAAPCVLTSIDEDGCHRRDASIGLCPGLGHSSAGLAWFALTRIVSSGKAKPERTPEFISAVQARHHAAA